jgi:hypothetical protein
MEFSDKRRLIKCNARFNYLYNRNKYRLAMTAFGMGSIKPLSDMHHKKYEKEITDGQTERGSLGAVKGSMPIVGHLANVS